MCQALCSVFDEASVEIVYETKEHKLIEDLLVAFPKCQPQDPSSAAYFQITWGMWNTDPCFCSLGSLSLSPCPHGVCVCECSCTVESGNH